MVKAKTGSGEPMSRSEGMRGDLQASAPDRIAERWLRKEVLPVYDSIVAGRSKAVPAKKAWALITAHMGRAEPRGG
jgi:hypothetical protein